MWSWARASDLPHMSDNHQASIPTEQPEQFLREGGAVKHGGET